ncbi:MAG: TldD/PmbA family protein [Defluviitaleaceae bacterium]|nr:TldD/PmbA family protein [Defluviitaleaceae bacterium]MCL2836122.1 TldD/PmbA family protein [Defluviitaleaceae bacterium]
MKEKLIELMAFCKGLGADYVDIRVKDIWTEQISAEDGKAKALSSGRSVGFGIRVYVDGSLGFAAANDLSKFEETARKAYEIACVSKDLQAEKIVLAPKPVVVDHFATPMEIDPASVPLSDKLDLLLNCEKIMKAVPGVSRTNSGMGFRKEIVIYCDTDGSYITQSFCQSGAGITATAIGNNDAQTRSYPSLFGGDYSRAGYEFVIGLDLLAHAEKIARESVELMNAPDCPSGIYDLIINPSQMVLQIHESIGHPTELDRVYGSEAAFAGASFLQPSDLGKDLVYGSPHVTVVADAVCKEALGTFGYDDEGVAAVSTVLIDKGIFKNFMTSRDTAFKVKQVSNGCGLADGWRNLPLVRMTNINLLPGEFEADELIEGINDGFMLDVNKSWSIDDKRINFQFSCEIAYEIKNGKLTGKVFKNPIYSGVTTEFWASCDGVANGKSWRIYGVPNCGKGQPMQSARCGHGSAPTRFRKVKVGVADVK